MINIYARCVRIRVATEKTIAAFLIIVIVI